MSDAPCSYRAAARTRIALTGLEDNELVELLAAAAGHDLDDDGVGLAHALRRETDGNPFFTAELLRHLGESGGIVLADDGRWALAGELEELGLPSSVRDVVGQRVERLGEEALRVLCLASVVGREFDLDLLAELADVDEDSLLDLLDTAVAASVLVESGTADRYRFVHALTRHSLYDELSPSRRQRAHCRIAEALETDTRTEDAATLAELAHHWVASTRPADIAKALDYVRRAGDAARDALAPDDAIRWYQQALDLLASRDSPDERTRAELLIALGTAQMQGAHPEYVDTLGEAGGLAERLDDTDLLVHAALGFFTHAAGAGGASAGGGMPVIQAALDRIGTRPTPNRARLLAALAHAHVALLEWSTCHALSLEALAVARDTGDDATFVAVVHSTQQSVATPDRRDQLIEDTERAVAIAERIGDPVLQASIRYELTWARYQRADIAGADAALAEQHALTEIVGLPLLRWQTALLTVGRLLLAGDVDQAETANEAALQLGTALGEPAALGVFGGMLYAIRQHQGRLDEIADFFIDAARDNPTIAVLRSTAITLFLEVGRIDEARERLGLEAADGFDFPHDGTWVNAMVNLAETAASTGDHSAARTLIDRLAPYADHVVTPAPVLVLGAVARPLARAATLLGDYDQAEEWFATAHDIHARLQAPFWTALGQLDHADLCLARRADGELERARQLVTTAAATANEHGCGGLTRRADALLADF